MPKVRLADVFPIEGSGISNDEYTFALASHFDFVVADEHHLPIFAVEFDGPSHSTDEQQRRDEVKNTLCDRFHLPLLRINSRYLEQKYRNLDLLTWFVETWFTERAIEKAQEQGLYPDDEPVMAWLAYTLPGHENRFPLWLSCEPLARIRRLHDEGRCHSRVPSLMIGIDEGRTWRALSWLRVTAEAGLFVRTGIRAQQFPIDLSEALEEISSFEIEEALRNHFEGKVELISCRQIETAIHDFRDRYQVLVTMVSKDPSSRSTA